MDESRMTDNDDHDPLADLNASPVNPLPGVVWLLILVVLGVEAALWAAGAGLVGGASGVGWRVDAIQRFTFSSAIQDWMVQNWRFPPMHLARYLTFGFIHTGPMHALFVAVLLAVPASIIAMKILGGGYLLVLSVRALFFISC